MKKIINTIVMISALAVMLCGCQKSENKKISKKGLHFLKDYYIIPIVANEVAKTKHKGLSPNGKATDSDSVSSRFESL